MACFCAIYAAAIAWTGGFDLRLAGVRLRSHEWLRPLLASVAAGAAAAWFGRERTITGSIAFWRALEFPGVARAIAFAAAVWTMAAGVTFGTYAVGGADSYGYLSEAKLLAQGRLTATIEVPAEFTWPDAAATLRPPGYRPGRSPDVIAPIYPPGFPLMLAPLTMISERAIFLLVPLFGALAVWVTYRLGAAAGASRARARHPRVADGCRWNAAGIGEIARRVRPAHRGNEVSRGRRVSS